MMEIPLTMNSASCIDKNMMEIFYRAREPLEQDFGISASLARTIPALDCGSYITSGYQWATKEAGNGQRQKLAARRFKTAWVFIFPASRTMPAERGPLPLLTHGRIDGFSGYSRYMRCSEAHHRGAFRKVNQQYAPLGG